MEKVFQIKSLKDSSSDYQYWSSKTYQARIEAVEILRLQYLQLLQKNETEYVQSRLQRVYRIIKQKQS